MAYGKSSRRGAVGVLCVMEIVGSQWISSANASGLRMSVVTVRPDMTAPARGLCTAKFTLPVDCQSNWQRRMFRVRDGADARRQATRLN